MPAAGGTYRFLRAIYPGRAGRFLSFLFVFQLMFSAPLSVASGCIGLSQYAGYLQLPGLLTHTVRGGWWVVGPGTLVAISAVVLAVLLLYRNLAKLRWISYVLWCTVIGTIAWILVTSGDLRAQRSGRSRCRPERSI